MLSIADYLNEYFESDVVKATFAGSGIIGTALGVQSPGTAYVLFHHVMGETNGKRGVWAYVKGGMGGLTQALARVARALNVEIRTGADVARIMVKDGTAPKHIKLGARLVFVLEGGGNG